MLELPKYYNIVVYHVKLHNKFFFFLNFYNFFENN
jgi:hypothetical protein